MKKKIFIIFVYMFILMFTGTASVQALAECEEIKVIGTRITELDGVIEVTGIIGTKKDFSVTKFEADGVYIYEVGPKTKEISQINSGWIEKDSDTAESFINIIKSGTKKENIKKYGLNNKEDLDIATKIAIDCYIDNIRAEVVKNYYKVKEGIGTEVKERAEKIINAASQMLLEKDEKTDRSPRKITVSGNEIFKQDNIKPNYYSLAYEVALEGEGALGYDVSIIAPNIQGYFITDKESKENKTEFTSSENVFKIMIPSEYKDLGFEIEIKVTGKYKDEKIFRAVEYLGEGEAKEDKPNEYIIYEDGLYRKEAKSIIFTHEKTEDNENGGDKQEPESPDNGEQNEETDKKPNPDDEIQENDKIKEDIEVKETVNASISKPNVPKEEKRLPRTRK